MISVFKTHLSITAFRAVPPFKEIRPGILTRVETAKLIAKLLHHDAEPGGQHTDGSDKEE